jgi:hypothetical protein
MRVPLLLAHGQGLISFMLIASVVGLVGMSCLVAAVIALVTKPVSSRKMALMCFLGFIACALVILFCLFSPLFIQLFGVYSVAESARL